MFLPPPLKSSAAIRAASTEPMPLVSWKMPEISLSTPTRTTLSEVSARASPHVAHDKDSASPNLQTFIDVLPRRGLHGALAHARLNLLPAAVGMDEDDTWHKRSVRPEKF